MLSILALALSPVPPATPALAPTAAVQDDEVPAGEAAAPRFTFGGSVRHRVERWNEFGFGGPPGTSVDDTFSLWNAMVFGRYAFSDDLQLFGRLKTASATERDLPGGTRPIDEDDLALEELYVDWTFRLPDETEVRMRPGRQWLRFGKQRLISPLPWVNTLRRFDGLRVDVTAAEWTFAIFATQLVPVDIDAFNEPDPGNKFHGLYLTRTGPEGVGGLDAYVLWSDRVDRTFNGTRGDDERWTIGGRTWAEAEDGSRAAELEGAVQLGTIGNEDVRSWMAGGELSMRIEDLPVDTRGYLRFDAGSGDSRPGGDVGTFDQLFPLGHGYFGMADLVGRQNALDLALGAQVDLDADLALELSHHTFWLLDSNDALYSAGGGVLRPGGVSDSRYVGHEIDLRGSYRIDADLTLSAGLAHVFAGSVLEDSASDEDVDFAYVSLTLTF